MQSRMCIVLSGHKKGYLATASFREIQNPHVGTPLKPPRRHPLRTSHNPHVGTPLEPPRRHPPLEPPKTPHIGTPLEPPHRHPPLEPPTLSPPLEPPHVGTLLEPPCNPLEPPCRHPLRTSHVGTPLEPPCGHPPLELPLFSIKISFSVIYDKAQSCKTSGDRSKQTHEISITLKNCKTCFSNRNALPAKDVQVEYER
ncbi:gibberellin-regulated protein 14-like [Penaeus monodon]|uniref:gibberellin-regulated protein 14-like n=1 Tax=Penaeus monodon TaxID=6687 RepID=UPI0018A7BB18|nr:gibberellin-regulated protein 14-like [Penaeus monodon]